MSQGLTIERRPDGIAVATLNTPDKPVNILSIGLMEEFEKVFFPLLDDNSVKGVVLASAKSSFIAGADIEIFDNLKTAEEGADISRRANKFMSRIADSSKPVVAAVHGATLGGGVEIVLACDYIVASDSTSTAFSLPEVQLGILPGAGGTQRLHRRVGLLNALPKILTGRKTRIRRAKRIGLVDAVTTPGGIADTAARAALLISQGKLTKPKRRKSWWEIFLHVPGMKAFILRGARKRVMKQTLGNYPAPLAALRCIGAGFWSLKKGLEAEAKNFGELVVGTPSRSLVHLFHGITALKKAPEGRPVKRLSVLGSGLMGSGIASVSLSKCPVVVRDIKMESLSGAARAIKEGLDKQLRSGSITSAERDTYWSRLHLTTDVEDLRDSDLIIEAVFEDLKLKRRVLAEAEERMADDAIFASNTSALPISEIASESKHPERILGMHYFSPVPKMPLLEIIRTEKTADWAVDTARAFGQAQGKTVIVVKDGPGFYTTRMLAPALNEVLMLLGQGAKIEDIDRAMLQFGFPIGPVKLIDEVGIDVGAHVSHDLGKVFEKRGGGSGSDALTKMFEAGFLGKKNKKGFYTYGKKKKPNPAVYSFFGGSNRSTLEKKDIQDKIALSMVNEAVRCLEEGIIQNAHDGDVGAILGLGFPPFRGGPFRYVDDMGARVVVERLEQFAKQHQRYQPAKRLMELAESGDTFHAK